jgi:integrase
VAELLAGWLRHAREYYRGPGGEPTSELHNFTMSLRPLNHLYAALPAAEFSPLKLKAVRKLMVDGYEHPQHGPQPALSRVNINHRIGRIKRVFAWAVSEELVPASVHQALQTVKGLKAGRSDAREGKKVKPVPPGRVEQTLPHLLPVVAGAVRLQALTGMRSGELLPIRLAEIDRSAAVWVYRPNKHKTAYRGKERAVALGPRAQAVLGEFISIRCPLCGVEGRPPRLGSRDGALCGPCADRTDEAGVCGPWQRVECQPAEEYLFSPARALAEWHEDKRAARKSKVQPSQRNRKKRRPRKEPGQVYSPNNYHHAIRAACDAAGVPRWHPHQLRHSHGTDVRKRYGLDAAQVALGHSEVSITQVYAEADLALAVRVAQEMG